MRPFTSYLTDREDTGKNRYLAAFLLACLVAAAIFIPFMIQDQGYFFYFGDYNVQDIPFYQHAHEMIRSGNWNWDFGTDLGANFIGSYSFYMLGSPFFWLMLPFPNWMIPYLMGPMFILKFGVCGLTAYCYIARFLRNKNFALLGSLLYAFSGFTVYNVFFNHFVDVVALFPLLLIGLEMYVVDGKKGFFAVAVAINMMVNYFFFVGQAVFLLIYFLCRLPSPHFCIKKRVFFGLAFETVLGCLGGMIIFLPGILAITGNPRVDNFLYGHDLLFYADTQRYGGILSSLFFMPEVPSRPNFFPQEWAKWSSLSAWLPLFSVTGVLAFFGNTGKNFVKRVLSVCLVMALVPVLNSAFYAFNSSYYARWFYMPVLLMALASVKVLEDRGASYRRPILITAVGVGFFTLIGLVPTQDGDKVKIGAEAMPDRFFMWVLVSVISLLLFYLLIYHLRPRGMFFRPALALLCAVAVGYSLIHYACGRSHSYGLAYMKDTALGGREAVAIQPDPENGDFFRSDYYAAMDNLGMFWNTPTIQCFHTVVPTSVIEFYEYLDITRDVHSSPPVEQYALRPLLSVKYLYDDQTFAQSTPLSVPTGFSLYEDRGDFRIYQNDLYLPMGFAYDTYLTRQQCDVLDTSQRARAMLQAIVLETEGVEPNAHLMENVADPLTMKLYRQNMAEDCQKLQDQAAVDFRTTKDGFLSHTDYDSEKLVFYSVPYDEGFTAYVNGKEVPIYRANVGFMAVQVPAGQAEIEFRYQAPGLAVGEVCLVTFAAIYLGYIIYIALQRRRQRSCDQAQQ